MKVTPQHLAHIQNAMNIMRRCKMPDAQNGEEYLAFAQTYYFLYDMLVVVDQELKAEQILQQAATQKAQSPQSSNTVSAEPLKNGIIETSTESKSKKSKKELVQRVD